MPFFEIRFFEILKKKILLKQIIQKIQKCQCFITLHDSTTYYKSWESRNFSELDFMFTNLLNKEADNIVCYDLKMSLK